MLVRKNRRNLLNGSPEQKNENRTALPVGEGTPAGAPFWVLYKSAALLQNRSGIGFLWQNLQFPFVGISQIFGNATKDRSIYQNRIDKALREWYCNHILREGCGQDEEDVRSYCRSGCQGRRRILLRRKLSLYDRHYYGRHYGVHFCCHYFHYWHNSIWLAWGTERLSL